MARAKFFTSKKSNSGTVMLFLRGRQVGSVSFDKVSKVWTLLNNWQDFVTFEQAEKALWVDHNLWLAE